MGFNVWKAQSKLTRMEVPHGQQQELLSAVRARGAGVLGLNTITCGTNTPLNSAPGAQSCSWAARSDTTIPAAVSG